MADGEKVTEHAIKANRSGKPIIGIENQSLPAHGGWFGACSAGFTGKEVTWSLSKEAKMSETTKSAFSLDGRG